MKQKKPLLNRYVKQGEKFVCNGVAVAPAVWRKCEQFGVTIRYGQTERQLRALIVALAANNGIIAAAAKNVQTETPDAFRRRLANAKTAAENANVAVFVARANAAAPVAELKELKKQERAKKREWKINEIAEKFGVSRDVAEKILIDRESVAAANAANRKAQRLREKAEIAAANAAALNVAAAPAVAND